MATYPAAITPAFILSPPEEFAPAHTKIFFPESRTNTSPWFMDDQAMSTCKHESRTHLHKWLLAKLTSVRTGRIPPVTLNS